MNIGKKITDFIVLEDGNIGRKAAVTTGALLATSVLGASLTSEVNAGDHCDGDHIDTGGGICGTGSCTFWHFNMSFCY